MAIQQLDLKLDEMNQGLVDEQQREQLADAPMPEKAIDMPAAPMPSEEGIQVAGGRGELIGEVLKKLKNVEIRKPPVAPITPVGPVIPVGPVVPITPVTPVAPVLTAGPVAP